ncbi:MAG: hypothetical protein ACQERC_03505 [Bacteroidota bacterium]
MIRIKYFVLYITVPLLFTILHSSCLKDLKKQPNQCSEELYIGGAHEVIEGESFTLTPAGYYETPHVNTTYRWYYPASTGWFVSTGNTEDMDDPEPITVEEADKRHEGDYRFSIHSGYDNCNGVDASISHEIQILPKPSPCFDSISTNYMEAYDTYYDNTTAGSTTPFHTEAWDSTSFEINANFAGASCEMVFEIPTPDYSSSYQLRDWWGTTSDGIENPLVEAEIHFNFSNEPGHPFVLKGDDQELYLKREGDDMFVTLCDVVLVHENVASRTVHLTGKIHVEL